MITGTYIELSEKEFQEAQEKFEEIKRHFFDRPPMECLIHYGITGPIWISFWDKAGEDGTGGLYIEYSGSDRQVFWMYDKAIEEGLYGADEEQQEKDMRELFVEILTDSMKEIALRSHSQQILAHRASRVLTLIAKRGNPLIETEKFDQYITPV